MKLLYFSIKFLLFALLTVPSTGWSQYMSGALLNGCGTEGANEYLFFTNSGGSFVPSASTIQVLYDNTTPIANTNGTSYTSSFLASGNATFVNSLNALLPSSCDFQFVNVIPGTTIIPAGALFMIMDDAPTVTPDFANLCGNATGNIYVLFSSDPTWTSTAGNFSNTGNTFRYFDITINGVRTTYRYLPNSMSNTAGAFAAWGPGGGDPTNYGIMPSCNVPLPVTLVSFELTATAAYVQARWVATDEAQFSHFILEKSQNMVDFQEVTRIEAAHAEQYAATDTQPYPGISYYRLKMVDADGSFTVSKAVAVQVREMDLGEALVYPNPAVERVYLPQAAGGSVSVAGTTAQIPQLLSIQNGYVNVAQLPSGIYLLRYQTPDGRWHTKRLSKF